jgi:putative holliday junction resolvase
MGVDYGFRRIGIALSDALGMIARPFAIIQRQTNATDFARLRAIIDHEQVAKLVVGLPTDSDGAIGQQAQRVIRWAHKLSAVIEIPIVFWDESHSSQQAETIRGVHQGRSQRHIDDAAAAVILQEYLDAGGASYEPGRPLDTLNGAD